MKRDHTKISPTAFNHIVWRTLYGIPYADEFLEAARKYCPAEYVFNKDILNKNKKRTNPNIAPMFEGRYKGGEKAIENFIRKNPNGTVLELAAGFSLHGARLAKKYPKIKYIETDLPEIIKIKEKITKEIGLDFPNLVFKRANALDAASVKKAVSLAKPGVRIAVYCEGLLSYFDDQEKKKIAKITETLLGKYGGVWITPDPALDAEARKKLKKVWPEYKRLVKKAEAMAKQKYDDHGFKNEKDTDAFFSSCGFEVQKIAWPGKLKSWKTAGYEKKKETEIGNVLKKFGKVWILSLR